jgi:hypothetical protein
MFITVSQQPGTGPYPEPHQSNPNPPITILRSILIASSLLSLGLPSGLVLSAYYIRGVHKEGGGLRVRSPPQIEIKKNGFCKQDDVKGFT